MATTHEGSSIFPQYTLPNGLRIVAQPMRGVQSVAIGFCIATGIRDEQPQEAGISHFIDGLAYQGTARQDVRTLTEAFEEIGARHSAGTGTELFWYTAQALGRHLETLVPLMAEVVRMPRFDPIEAEKVRDRQLQELAALEDEPMQKALDLLQRTYFAHHPYGNNALGTEETIRAIQPHNMQEFWRRTHTPNNTIIAAAGLLDFDILVQAVETACGDWQATEMIALPPAPKYTPRIEVLVRESSQQHIGIGIPGVAIGDPDYYALALLTTILGGTMNSRLFSEVREKRGLAYGIGASAVALRDAGMIRIYAGTVPNKAHETVAVIREELRKLEEGGVTEDELGRAKTVLKSRVIMGGESTRVRRNAIGTSLWYENRVRTLDEIRILIEAVTLEQIKLLSQRLSFSTQMTLVAIGPRSAEELLSHEN